MISVDDRICTGCRTCEFACAFQQKRSFHYNFSLIRIRKKQEEEGFFAVALCRHCAEPPCVPECPAEAISKDPQSGLVAIDSSTCTGCGVCVAVCPWNAPALAEGSGVAKVCDLCKGDPLCIKFCQPGALSIVEERA